MDEYIFDIEADDLIPGITKIHCLSYIKVESNVVTSTTDYKEITKFFSNDYVFVGHYVMGYDFRALKKVIGVEKPKKVVDTLALSWYLSPERDSHGLEGYGEEFGIPKPPIKNWKDLTIEEYIFRCERDVQINQRLWINQKKKLQEIYA